MSQLAMMCATPGESDDRRLRRPPDCSSSGSVTPAPVETPRIIATAKNQQTRELALRKRKHHVRAWLATESVGFVVVTCTQTVLTTGALTGSVDLMS